MELLDSFHQLNHLVRWLLRANWNLPYYLHKLLCIKVLVDVLNHLHHFRLSLCQSSNLGRNTCKNLSIALTCPVPILINHVVMDEVVKVRSKVQIVFHRVQHYLKIEGVLSREIILEQNNRLLELLFFLMSRNDNAGQIRDHLLWRLQGLPLRYIPEHRRTEIWVTNEAVSLLQTLLDSLQLLVVFVNIFAQWANLPVIIQSLQLVLVLKLIELLLKIFLRCLELVLFIQQLFLVRLILIDELAIVFYIGQLLIDAADYFLTFLHSISIGTFTLHLIQL